MLEFYQSLDWVFQTTIILFLIYLLIKWFGKVVTALLVVIHPLLGGVVGIAMILEAIVTGLFVVWSVVKLLILLL